MVDKAKVTEYMDKANSLETKVCFMDELGLSSYNNELAWLYMQRR